MFNLTLTDQEMNVLTLSVNHCLETCKQGGPKSGCTDCETLKQVAEKIAVIKKTADQ